MGEIWMYFEMQSPTNEKNFVTQLELGVYGGKVLFFILGQVEWTRWSKISLDISWLLFLFMSLDFSFLTCVLISWYKYSIFVFYMLDKILQM